MAFIEISESLSIHVEPLNFILGFSEPSETHVFACYSFSGPYLTLPKVREVSPFPYFYPVL